VSIFADNQAVRHLNVRFAQGNAVPHPVHVLGRDQAEVEAVEGLEVAQDQGVVQERGIALAHLGNAAHLLQNTFLVK
jgi:hypothetical protein